MKQVFPWMFPLLLLPLLGSGLADSEGWDHYTGSEKLEHLTDLAKEANLKKDPDYVYSSFMRPDPFVPPMEPTFQNLNPIAMTSPLQRIPLTKISLVGVWKLKNGQKKALVMTEKSMPLTVRIGDPIGTHGGIVVEISSEYLLVKETITGPTGVPHISYTELWMQGTHEEKEEARQADQLEKKIEPPAVTISAPADSGNPKPELPDQKESHSP